MNTIIQTTSPNVRLSSARRVRAPAFRSPNYDCKDQPGMLVLTVYLPGINASTVEIEARGPDLLVTAEKERFVRRNNWRALHLESAQRDYRLRLRLGTRFDYAAMDASIDDGILRIALPKRAAA